MKKLLLSVMLAITSIAFAMEIEKVEIPKKSEENLALSVQDLINQKKLPEVDEIGMLDLSEQNLISLEGLQNIPNPERITYLYLDDNKISLVPENIFNAFSNLKSLDFTGNPILELQPKTFANLLKLEELHLEGTLITEIPQGLINHLTELKVLHLFENKLESLPKGVLNRLVSLEEFGINDNQITEFDPNLFRNNNNLTSIDLSNNNIYQLPTITHLNKLKTVSINGNKDIVALPKNVITFILKHKIWLDNIELLGEIPPYTLGQLINDLGDNWRNQLITTDENGWTTLNLDNRGLTDLSDLNLVLDDIHWISAQNNYLKEFSPDIFYLIVNEETRLFHLKFPNLLGLELSNNQLDFKKIYYENVALYQFFRISNYCPYLYHIDLSHNKFKQINKKIFEKFNQNDNFQAIINLNNNQIELIDENAFNGVRNLHELDLSYNNLNIIPIDLFKSLHNLEHLTLCGNTLGSKDQFQFPPKAEVVFYPQKLPKLKLLAAQKLVASLERKNLIQTVQAIRNLPLDDLYTMLKNVGATKKIVNKIGSARLVLTFLTAWSTAEIDITKNIESFLQSLQQEDAALAKQIQETFLALAPEPLRGKIVQAITNVDAQKAELAKQEALFSEKTAEELEVLLKELKQKAKVIKDENEKFKISQQINLATKIFAKKNREKIKEMRALISQKTTDELLALVEELKQKNYAPTDKKEKEYVARLIEITATILKERASEQVEGNGESDEEEEELAEENE